MCRLFRLTLFLALSSVVAMACGLDNGKGKAGEVIVPTKFVFEKGWRIPDLKQAEVWGKGTDKFGGTSVSYRIKPPMMLPLQGFEFEVGSRTLKFIPGYVLQVDSITEYQAGGRTYKYMVSAGSLRRSNPPMWMEDQPSVIPEKKGGVPGGISGCGYTVVRVLDHDGDGIFETLEVPEDQGGVRISDTTAETNIPDWAQRLFPNQAVLKEYKEALEAARMAVAKSKIPPAELMLPTQLPKDPAKPQSSQ
jgi:hypothetical protein